MTHDQEAAVVAAIIRTPDQAGRPGPAGVPVHHVTDAQRIQLLERFGVNDLHWLAGASDRTVQLPASSALVCPAHETTLKPDACRSCSFLAGEAG
jgi:hypothetical protein